MIVENRVPGQPRIAAGKDAQVSYGDTRMNAGFKYSRQVRALPNARAIGKDRVIRAISTKLLLLTLGAPMSDWGDCREGIAMVPRR